MNIPVSIRFSVRGFGIMYLTVLHILLIFCAFFAIQKLHVGFWIAFEIVLICSVIASFKLFSHLYQPIQMMKESVDFLKESDFSSTLLKTGIAETDTVIDVYNAMLLRLRSERVRIEERGILLQTLVNASPVGIIVCDEKLQINSLNPALERMFPEVVATQSTNFSGHTYPFEEYLKSIDVNGSTIFTYKNRRFKFRKTLFYEKAVPYYLIQIEELTAELAQSESATYKRIIRTLVHEVNNSMGAASSLIDSARKYSIFFSASTPREHITDFHDALEIANGRLKELEVFVKNYAELVKLPKPVKESVLLRECFERLVTMFSKKITQYKIDVKVDVEPSLSIRVDKILFMQMLINLLKNAIESIIEKAKIVSGEIQFFHGNIHLHGERQNNYIIVRIDDNGLGLSANSEKELLTPFFTTKETGQGIGLTLVREIVSAHGFDFVLENIFSANEPKAVLGARAEIITA